MAPRKPRQETNDRKAGDEATYDATTQQWETETSFTAADLGKRVTFDDRRFATVTDDKKLTFEQAEKILKERLIALGDARYALGDRSVAQLARGSMDVSAAQITANLILNNIPEEYRGADVLAKLDLRPYFAAMQDVGIAKVAAHEYAGQSFSNILGVDAEGQVPVDLSEISSFYLNKEQARIKESLTNGQKEAGVEGTPGELEAKISGAQYFNPQAAGLVPDADATITTDVVQGGTVNNAFDPKSIAQQRQTFTPYDIDDFRQMVATDQWGLEQLAAQEKALAAEQGNGYFPMRVEEGSYSSLDVQGGKPIAPTQSRPTMGVNQAMDYLRTLTPSQVKDVQKKLAMAGYYDRVVQNAEGGMANAVPIEEGYAFDPATQAAWRLLLTDAVKENRPISRLLGEKAPTYREERRKKQLSGLAELDGDMVALMANDYAQSIIGRTLTGQEQAMMRDYLYQLREDRAGYVVGADDNTADQNLPNEMGFTEDDVRERLTDQYTMEAQMTKDAERAYARRQIMGG